METLSADVFGSILQRVSSSKDRKHCSLVSKHWLAVEGFTRSSLRVLHPNILHTFLPRFSNLLTFKAYDGISDSDLTFLGKTCQHLQVLELYMHKSSTEDDGVIETNTKVSVTNHGIAELSIGCLRLRRVSLRNIAGVGDEGVIALIKSNPELVSLQLDHVKVTDNALKTIGAETSSSLEALELDSCPDITDIGLVALATGFVSRTLKKLILLSCSQITDYGISILRQMNCLEELSLSTCGPSITDVGGVAVSAIRTLKILDLSWLMNITDVTLIAVSRNCSNLVRFDVTGCNISGFKGAGISSYANHPSVVDLYIRDYRFGRVRNVNACMLFYCDY